MRLKLKKTDKSTRVTFQASRWILPAKMILGQAQAGLFIKIPIPTYKKFIKMLKTNFEKWKPKRKDLIKLYILLRKSRIKKV